MAGNGITIHLGYVDRTTLHGPDDHHFWADHNEDYDPSRPTALHGLVTATPSDEAVIVGSVQDLRRWHARIGEQIAAAEAKAAQTTAEQEGPAEPAQYRLSWSTADRHEAFVGERQLAAMLDTSPEVLRSADDLMIRCIGSTEGLGDALGEIESCATVVRGPVREDIHVHRLRDTRPAVR